MALLLVALLQLGVALDVHNTLVDDVGEGARFGALADRGPADGAERARELIGDSFPASYASGVTASTVRTASGAEVEVRASVPVPLLGLVGGPVRVVVVGHGAVQELP